MAEKTLELGIDEMTVVLQIHPHVKQQLTPFDWKDCAECIIEIFLKKSDFVNIFGEQIMQRNPPQGYTVAYTYGEHNFYIAVAYHDYQINMGVAVKFSAQALDYYCVQSGLKPYQFLQRIRDNFYSIRISRVDLTADFINEGVDVTAIYQGLIDRKIAVFREYESKRTGKTEFRRMDMNYQGIIKGGEVPTVYLGSVKSNSRLRIYDKRREQLERNGTKYDKARACIDWVRFEGVYRNEYSHQIGDALLKIKTDDEYANLIACTLIQKFRLMYIDNGVLGDDTEYSQLLLDCITNGILVLKAPTSRNYDLAKSMMYIFAGSGAMSTLFKIKKIWGDDAVSTFLKFMFDCLNEYAPNDDCSYWLRKNAKDYIKAFPDFDKFMKDTIVPILWKGGKDDE